MVPGPGLLRFPENGFECARHSSANGSDKSGGDKRAPRNKLDRLLGRLKNWFHADYSFFKLIRRNVDFSYVPKKTAETIYSPNCFAIFSLVPLDY
jgi:hypothetical protein